MAYEQRNNSGTLFQNKRKKKDTHPDYEGKIMVNGVLYELSGWKKQAQSDPSKTFLSLSVRPPREQEQQGGGEEF